MKFIKIFARGEGCQIPRGFNFLLVAADQFDAHGEWVTTAPLCFKTQDDLWRTLKLVASKGEPFTIKGSPRFRRMAKRLKCDLKTCEWTKFVSPSGLESDPNTYSRVGEDCRRQFRVAPRTSPLTHTCSQDSNGGHPQSRR